MIKKLFTVAALCLSLSAFACWFDVGTFNCCFIAGLNNYTTHFNGAATQAAAVFYNGQTVDLPITVFIKATPISSAITGAKLQYKVNSGSWVTVKTYTNPTWTLNYSTPIALFGRNNINPVCSAGDTITIRLWITDGTQESGDLNTDPGTIPDTITGSTTYFAGRWSPPFVMRVVYSGNRRAKQ